MSDIWNIPPQDEKQEENTPVPPAAADDTPPAEQPVETQPAEPADSQPAQQPTTAPFNGWSSDGSYRYVPPRQEPPTPPAQGPYTSPAGQPTYSSPAYTPYGSTPPTGAPVPPAPYHNPKPPKKNRGWVVAVALLGALAVVASVVLVVFALVGGIGGVTPDLDQVYESDVSDTSAANADAPTLEIDKWDEDDGGLSPKEVVNRNYDSTVVLTTYAQSTNFNFGESTLTEAGSASGIVMSADGYIITNWHCVINENTGKAYDRIDVTTYNGKTYEDAKVIGADESTDLAVIKIAAKNLAAAQFGDSNELAVGDRVTALGNAAGLSWTATFGYVSALARDVYDDTGYAIKCLQVDAAINPGNSGGPLLNKQGLVVGINSAKIAASGYEGLGFSIPINEAKTIIDSLLKNGYVKGRVALGITGQTVSSGIYKGFMIASIDEKSSLNNTKAQVGDLIVAVDNETIVDYGELRAALAKHKVGDTVTLKLLRSDRRTGQVSSLNVTVTLKEQKSN
ncbi:MAG: trypsin-like peptidase domain-containing protein [Clostridia bacterium]|nr:trypsin-like peptidase domain-containing protein [Clostridia bacterium]